MELHVDLAMDRTNRRRAQNRMAQRKFRQARAEASNQRRAQDSHVADNNVNSHEDITLNDAVHPPLTAPPPFQHEHVPPGLSNALSLSHFITPAVPPPSHRHDRSTAIVNPSSSSNSSNSPGLGDFTFTKSFAPSANIPLRSQATYQSHFDQAVDFVVATGAASLIEVDSFLALGPGDSLTIHPDISQRLQPVTSGLSSRAFPVEHQPEQSRQSSRSSSGIPVPPPQNSSSSAAGDSTSTNPQAATEDHDKGWLSTLHIAARRGHQRIVRTLIEHDIDCNERDSDGRTALIHAAIDGHEHVARALLAQGALISHLDRRQRSALHWAVLGGHEAVLWVLLEYYADRDWEHGIDAYDELGWTALHIAAEKDFEAGVVMLLQAGADLHAKARKTCNGDNDEEDTRISSRA
ncbi:ankyrin repeat-containing domain protein [Dactylonectria estremocensis]|uniref:Ankyrin repeat-containing domain protein n=1 Tax=Dactylonectria estremocensis TaxID=1079267 RepID=A0A9P9E648_9HYPO|nr:ankyrin repeat-containing domain protein [Dactylonectria estremocensis]